MKEIRTWQCPTLGLSHGISFGRLPAAVFTVAWTLPASFLPPDLPCLLPLTCHTHLALATPASSLFLNTLCISPAPRLCSYCSLFSGRLITPTFSRLTLLLPSSLRSNVTFLVRLSWPYSPSPVPGVQLSTENCLSLFASRHLTSHVISTYFHLLIACPFH